MKKLFRTAISLVLIVALLLSVSVTAFAAGEEPAPFIESDIALDEVVEEQGAEEAGEEQPPILGDNNLDDIIIEEATAQEQIQVDVIAEAKLAEGVPYADGEIIVVFKQSIGEAAAQAAVEEQGGAEMQSISSLTDNLAGLVRLGQNETVAQAVARYSASPSVEYAQPNYVVGQLSAEAETTAQDPDAGYQWHHEKVNTVGAWSVLDSIPQKSKVRVAVIDSATDITHSDLVGNLDVARAARFNYSQQYPYLTSGFDRHGTHVSGIIGATANNGNGGAGVASGNGNNIVEILPIDVFIGESAYTSDLINSISYAKNNGCRVINLSLGAASDPIADYNRVYRESINSVVAAGVVVVAASGNENSTGTFIPSDFDSVISVINTRNYLYSTDNCRSANSNYGGTKDVSAPGSNINSTLPGGSYGALSGTSMASPVVAGVAAMVLYANPSLTAAQVRSILQTTATDLYTTGFDIYTAYGNVNAKAAVEAALGNVQPTPSGMPAPQSFKVLTIAGSQDLQLSWEKIGDSSSYTVAGYNMYRSEKQGAGYTKIAEMNAETLEYLDAGLEDGKAYYYKVAGFYNDGASNVEGNQSEVVFAVVGKPFGAPADLAVSGRGINEVVLSWNTVSEAQGYNIYRSLYSGYGYSLIKELVGSASTGYVDVTGEAGKTYFYKVAACRGNLPNREESPHAGPIEAVAGSSELGTPKNLKADNSVGVGAIIRWDQTTSAQGYNVYRSEYKNYGYSLIKELAGATNLSYLDSDILVGKTYYYKVAAYKGEGASRVEGSISDAVSLLAVEKKLGAPISVMAVGDETIRLSWGRVEFAQGYEVYRAESTSGDFKLVKTNTDISQLLFEDTNVIPGQTYYYKICAYLKQSEKILRGEFSTVVWATVSGAVVGVPAGLKAVSNAYDEIKLSWNSLAGASGYYIYWTTAQNGSYTLLRELSSASTISTMHSKVDTGKEYFYKIKAYKTIDGKKFEGNFSTAINGNAQVPKPESLTAKGASTKSIELSWSRPVGANGYYIYRSATKSGGYTLIKTIENGATIYYKDSSCPKPGTKYYYKVRSYRLVGLEKMAGGTAGSVAGQTKSNGVTGVKAAASANNQITVSWSKKSGASGYQVYYSKSSSGSFARAGSSKSNRFVMNVSPNTKYYIKVRHFVKSGGKVTYGSFSNVVSATAVSAVPNFFTGMSKVERPYDTAFGFSIRNAANKPMYIYEKNSKLVDPYDNSKNCWLTMYDANDIRRSVIEVGPGQTVYLTFENKNGFRYYKNTQLHVEFNFDEVKYLCNASSQKSSYKKL